MASTSNAIHSVKSAAQGQAAPQVLAEKTKASKALVAGFWIVTALFCLEMSFTAYYELLPQGAQAFARLGFPANYFRIELSLAKLVGVAALLVPMRPARVNIWLKEWAYAGFAINLVSAIIAHLSIHDIPQALAPSSITSVLWALSYYFWRRLQATRTNA
jgi:putative oxidoreductase